MAISLREIVTGVNSGAAASVNIGAGTQAGDLLLAFGWSDFYSLGTFGPPSGGGWTQVTDGTADLGTDNSKCRAWTKTAAGGSATITLAPIIDEDVALAVLVLEGADTGTPVDDADNATSPGTGSPAPHVAPSVSPSTSDAYLVCAAGTSVFNGGAAYTPPGGMTERAEFSSPGNVTTQTVATEQLSAAGATGTRTFNYGGNNDPGVAVSVAIRTASAAAAGLTATMAGPAPGMRGPAAEPRAWAGVPGTAAPTTHDADVTVSATGEASATATADLQGSATVTATGGTSATADRDITGAAAVATTGGLSAAGTQDLIATAATAATAALATAAGLDLSGAVTLAATGALAVVGEGGGDTSTTVAATGSLTTTATVDRAGEVTVAAAGEMAAASDRTAVATAAAAALGGLLTAAEGAEAIPPVTPVATSQATATAAFGGSATVAATATSTSSVSEV